MGRKINRKQAIEVCVNTLEQALLDTNNYGKLLLNIDSIRRILKEKLMFRVPIYADHYSFTSEVLKDVREFMSNAEDMRFSYSAQEFKIFGDEVVSLLVSFFRSWIINSFLKEFSLLTTLMAVSIPSLIISLINLFIR